jgi:regulator of sirC expression with transglutaminase-like and TPR domain
MLELLGRTGAVFLRGQGLAGATGVLFLDMSDELKIVTTVASEAEAELVRERLSAADIQAISQRTIGGPEWGFSGARDVFVSARDLDRAHEVLKADEGSFSDDELARLSDEAGRQVDEH